jgi:WD40 repeat protein
MGYVNHVAFAPDGARLVSTSGDQTLKIWDTHRAAELATLYGHHGMVNSVEFTKDGRMIYSSGYDGEIRFWEAPPLAEIDLSTMSPSKIRAARLDSRSFCASQPRSTAVATVHGTPRATVPLMVVTISSGKSSASRRFWPVPSAIFNRSIDA